MNEIINTFLNPLPTLVLLLVIGVTIFILGKGADILIDQAVTLSIRWNVPKVIIGATIISLGTTLPEMTVSVMAALRGQPGIALGNAVGSVIANTGLILGGAAILGKIPVDTNLVKRQGSIKVLSIILLLIASIPILGINGKGTITRPVGILFLAILAIYSYFSIKWSKEDNGNKEIPLGHKDANIIGVFIKLIIGIILVIASSSVLIQAVEISAIRIGIPESIIAATLVAFGTSLPEFMMAINSVRKGHGEIALGNVIGANILNILFVIGASATVSAQGLLVPVNYYYLQYPTLLLMGILFLVFSVNKGKIISRTEGIILLSAYVIYTVLNFVIPI